MLQLCLQKVRPVNMGPDLTQQRFFFFCRSSGGTKKYTFAAQKSVTFLSRECKICVMITSQERHPVGLLATHVTPATFARASAPPPDAGAWGPGVRSTPGTRGPTGPPKRRLKGPWAKPWPVR